MDIVKIVEEKTRGYSLYSQDGVKDPLVLVKLFDFAGSASWFITEYDSKGREAF